jgi:hypothetical protein
MQRDDNPLSLMVSDKTVRTDQEDAGRSDVLIETHLPEQYALDVGMEVGDGNRER